MKKVVAKEEGVKLTGSLVSTTMLTPAESSIAELAFVLLLWYQRRLPSRSRRGSDGI